MASWTVKAAVLRHVRIPATSISLARSKLEGAQIFGNAVRSMSGHAEDITMDDVAYQVLDVVKCYPKVDPAEVKPLSHFQKDLGLDSLDKVQIMMALQEEFKLEIPDKEPDKIDSCNLAIEYIFNHFLRTNFFVCLNSCLNLCTTRSPCQLIKN